MELRGDIIREFLRERNLTRSGTKPELRQRIEQHIEEGKLTYTELVNFIDRFAPLGKQHVYLYDGPENEVSQWRDEKYVREIIENNGLIELLISELPLILPQELTISTIEYHSSSEFKIYAVQKREGYERKPEYDTTTTRDNREILLKAYEHIVTRLVVIFRWNLVANTATLQISQLPSSQKYEDVEIQFSQLVENWLNFSAFEKVSLRRTINKLFELERDGSPEARSHNFSFLSPGGRKVDARSPTPDDSVFGEELIDNAMNYVEKNGVGNLGNFYWLPNYVNPNNNNPLTSEVHTIIVGKHNRINFTTNNRQEDIEYVLSRVRILSQQ
ncbi:SAP domain-containing protein [Candidatus Aerophobetes bacterium]|nr:SAP domain-containing protein [Candidatus Aerophobetes bacterium]